MESVIHGKENKMEWFLISLAVGGCVLAAALACFYRHREKRTLQKIDQMLDEAINGNFTEKDFDESLLSSVESKLAQYLSASAVSARNLSEEKDKIKTLIADISHQTKTPLSNILLYTELLGEQDLPGDSRIYTDALEAQAKKLQFLIASLVKTSRLETGILALHPKENQVSPMLRKAAAEVKNKALEKDIAIRLEESEATAVFDPKWTEEAVCNLLDNAIKYTPKGGRVDVKVTPYDLFCRIDVTDNGIGIPEEIQSKIFRRFYRGGDVSELEGVGIGLYLVRQIAAGQGGYVKVKSKKGKGSVFSLFLPAAQKP